jgi:nitroreductase
MSRQAEHPIEAMFTARWSPRAMSGAPLERELLERLFEAARWAPSSGNNQPWRFVYAIAGTPHFDGFFQLLNEGNQAWCKRAGALIIVTSKNTRESGKPSRTHSFDTGAAWMSLALQGSAMKLVVHGMEGFDYDKAAEHVHLPPEHTVECMIAVGYPGRLEDLPEKQQAREQPNDRKSISAFIFEASF